MTWTPEDVNDYDRRVTHWASRWMLYDDHLTALCNKYPRHNRLDAVIAKVGLIQRAYEAGLERHIIRRNGRNGVEVTAEEFNKNHQSLDQIISSLRRVAIRDKLNAANLGTVLAAHKVVLDITNSVARKGNHLRSFASKYLHFHCPIVPLYDARACGVIRRRKHWYGTYYAPRLINDLGVNMPNPSEYDATYALYCLRFLYMQNGAMDAGAKVTVRKLDAYLIDYA